MPELRVRPSVQGAALVLDNKTGGILAMAGGFSHPLSQFNGNRLLGHKVMISPDVDMDSITILSLDRRVHLRPT